MGEVRKGGFDEQDRAEHVDGVDLRECFRCDFLHRHVPRDPRIIDQDVDLEFARFGVREVVLRRRDQMRRPVWVTHVGLNRYGLDSMGGLKR